MIVISRMLVGLYSSHILTEFIVVAMAIVGKSLYLRSVLRGYSTVSAEDLSAANRIFVCLAARFVQHGTLLLAESVKNAVRAVFIKVSLQEPMSRILLDSLVSQVRHEVETACGKSILDDCVFGRLEEMIGANLSTTKRRLFIAMVTEARRRMKDPHFRQILIDQVAQDLETLLDCALEKGDLVQTIPLLAVLPKLAKKYHSMFQAAPIGVMRQLAATVFVDSDSDTHECLLHL